MIKKSKSFMLNAVTLASFFTHTVYGTDKIEEVSKSMNKNLYAKYLSGGYINEKGEQKILNEVPEGIDIHENHLLPQVEQTLYRTIALGQPRTIDLGIKPIDNVKNFLKKAREYSVRVKLTVINGSDESQHDEILNDENAGQIDYLAFNLKPVPVIEPSDYLNWDDKDKKKEGKKDEGKEDDNIDYINDASSTDMDEFIRIAEYLSDDSLDNLAEALDEPQDLVYEIPEDIRQGKKRKRKTGQADDLPPARKPFGREFKHYATLKVLVAPVSSKVKEDVTLDNPAEVLDDPQDLVYEIPEEIRKGKERKRKTGQADNLSPARKPFGQEFKRSALSKASIAPVSSKIREDATLDNPAEAREKQQVPSYLKKEATPENMLPSLLQLQDRGVRKIAESKVQMLLNSVAPVPVVRHQSLEASPNLVSIYCRQQIQQHLSKTIG